MNNQIDKFFNQKLSGHSIAPNPEAWSRVAGGLSKKNKTIVWFRAAAAILILMLAGMLWYYTSQTAIVDAEQLQTAEKIEAVQEETPSETLELEPMTEEIIIAESVGATETESSERNQLAQRRTSQPSVPKNEPIPSVQELVQESVSEVTIAALPESLEPKQVEEAISLETTKPIVIVYELKPIPTIPDTEGEFLELPEKRSTLRKVLTLANDVRSGESKIGGLRQAKEEILAFNFKKEDKNAR